MLHSTSRPATLPPLLAEARAFHADVLFNRIYDLAERALASSRRKELLRGGAGRAVRLLERRRSEARRQRYAITPDGPFAVFQWIPTYDGRDAITGHSKHTLARFAIYEDAERFLACEYIDRECAEYDLEIEGPFCVLRLPLLVSTDDGDTLPF